jgi:CheY-like chemotaxis protein
MNNLVKKQIFGGRDSLMYPYIHDYYVDDLKDDLVKDNWSSQIRGGGSGQQVRVQKPTQKDIMEAYDALDNEKKNEIYQQQLKRAEEEAYKKAQAKIKAEEEFDIIFIDHKMQEMDGVEVMKVLRLLETYKIPRLVMLTANAMPGMKEHYIKEGFDEYLSKPIDIKELDKVIKRFYRSKNQ